MPALDARIDADMSEGQVAGVSGTPSLYVNGRKLELGGPINVAIFEKLAKGKLKESIAQSEKDAPMNACRMWLKCLGKLASLNKKGLSQLQGIAKTLEKQARSGQQGVLAACRAGLAASLQSFPGAAPDACK